MSLPMMDEEEVSNDEEITQVKVLMALADDELSVGKNHARNGEWINLTMKKLNILLSIEEDSDWQTYLKYINIDLKYVEEQRLNLLSKYNKIVFELNKCRDDLLALKETKLEAVTFQIQNTKLTKLNRALQDHLKEEKKGKQPTETSSKNDVKENPFIYASLDYDHEIVPKSKDWVKRLNPDRRLPNFNTTRILVPKSQDVDECLQLTEASGDPDSSKESGSKSQTPLPPLKNLQGDSPSFEVMTLTYQDHSPNERSGLGTMKHTKPETQESSNKSVSGTVTVCDTELKEDHRTSDHDMYVASLKSSKNYKAQPYQYTFPSKQILKVKEKPFPSCTHCGFNDHRHDDCLNYHECEIYGSYDHYTSGHNRVIHKYIREPIWYLDSGCSRSMTGVKSYLHKYVKQPGPKDKACLACEKGKHKRASFKTKQIFSIRKCLHLLHMDLFGPVSPMSINHKKYTLVIVDEYSRYTWVHFLRKKSQASEIIMSFIRMVENQIDVKVKQIRTNNGTEFRNFELESFCDEKGISQNFSSPYTPRQNGIAERKNRTLIEAARTMPNGSVLSKYFWIEVVRIAYYTQN
ncbi:retrovirus-related pol polyprotein from transposon TNT 1-94 [Tanacetum coccineum]